MNGLAGLGMRLLRVPQSDERVTVHTAEELARLLAESREGGFLAEEAHALMSGALGMGRQTLDAITVEAARVVSVAQGATVAEAEALVVQHGVSRLLVLDGAGRSVGFVHAKDLLAVPADGRDRPLPLARIRRVLVLPSTMGLDEVLVAMQRARTHVAAVVGPTGAWTGLATLEDVLESVVGDIVDESDSAG